MTSDNDLRWSVDEIATELTIIDRLLVQNKPYNEIKRHLAVVQSRLNAVALQCYLKDTNVRVVRSVTEGSETQVSRTT